MELVKICPACQTENPIHEVMCQCMADISSVTPSVKGGAPSPLQSQCNVILLHESSGMEIILSHEDIIGRQGIGAETLGNTPTVSRHHAQVTHFEGTWWLEDFGSTNGTWINQEKLSPRTIKPIQIGDIIYLSRSCVLKVIS